MSKNPNTPRYVAFQRGKCIAEGSEAEIAAQLAARSISPYAYGANEAAFDPAAQAMVFDIATGERIELIPDTTAPVAQPEVPAPPPAGPGRPKLGVVAREVTLLPHDWEWLSQQPGRASVTLRKLVLTARRMSLGADRARQAKIVCYRFVTAIAGHEAGYEEATRALFTGKPDLFAANTETWPADVRDHARLLANAAFVAHAASAPAAPSTGAST